MLNPYFIFQINPQASKKEIQQAFMKLTIENRKTNKYTGQFLINCQRILLDPSKRLAADFLFPSRLKSYRPKEIPLVPYSSELRINKKNIFSTLDEMINVYENK